jgi:hypothetical protein
MQNSSKQHSKIIEINTTKIGHFSGEADFFRPCSNKGGLTDGFDQLRACLGPAYIAVFGGSGRAPIVFERRNANPDP